MPPSDTGLVSGVAEARPCMPTSPSCDASARRSPWVTRQPRSIGPVWPYGPRPPPATHRRSSTPSPGDGASSQSGWNWFAERSGQLTAADPRGTAADGELRRRPASRPDRAGRRGPVGARHV